MAGGLLGDGTRIQHDRSPWRDVWARRRRSPGSDDVWGASETGGEPLFLAPSGVRHAAPPWLDLVRLAAPSRAVEPIALHDVQKVPDEAKVAGRTRAHVSLALLVYLVAKPHAVSNFILIFGG